MANYVDYGYWIQGYGEGDLSRPDRYVVVGYWTDGYAEYEDADSAVASITASATLSISVANFVLGSASINASGSASASAIRQRIGLASVSSSGSLSITPVNFVLGTASVSSEAIVTANGAYVIGGNASFSGSGSFTAYGSYNVNARAVVVCTSSFSALGNIIGEEWIDVSPEQNIWTIMGAGDGYVEYDYWTYGYTNSDFISPNDVGAWSKISASSDNWVRQ